MGLFNIEDDNILEAVWLGKHIYCDSTVVNCGEDSLELDVDHSFWVFNSIRITPKRYLRYSKLKYKGIKVLNIPHGNIIFRMSKMNFNFNNLKFVTGLDFTKPNKYGLDSGMIIFTSRGMNTSVKNLKVETNGLININSIKNSYIEFENCSFVSKYAIIEHHMPKFINCNFEVDDLRLKPFYKEGKEACKIYLGKSNKLIEEVLHLDRLPTLDNIVIVQSARSDHPLFNSYENNPLYKTPEIKQLNLIHSSHKDFNKYEGVISGNWKIFE